VRLVITISLVAPTRVHDLRRRVLRDNRADASVHDARDDDDGALHVAALRDDVVVGSGSVYPSEWPLLDSVGLTYQLRYLAVDPLEQRQGLGMRMMARLEEEIVARGAAALWANGRDSALDFYVATGWSIVPNSAHLSPETQLPHHVIVKLLTPTPREH